MKAQDSERVKLLNLKDSYEKKEIEWNKQSSELRGQLIELSESNVSELPNIVSKNDDFDTEVTNFFIYIELNRRNLSDKIWN